MNDELIELYTKVDHEYGPLLEEFNSRPEDSECFTNPFYAVVSEAFVKARNRIIILGQETNTWGGEFGDDGAYHRSNTVNDLCKLYDLYINHRNQSSGQYWNYCHYLEETASKNAGFFFFNTAFVGKCGRTGYIEKLQPKILSEVFEIVRPNLAIFLCGPNYDSLIKSNFGDSTCFTQATYCFTTRQFARIEGVGIPAYRCYHPGYLYRATSLREAFEKVIFPMIQ